MVSNDSLTWSQVLALGAWVRYGPGSQQTPKVAFIGHKWEVATVSKTLISETCTSKPGQEELDSPTLLSTLVTTCSCWRASSLQTAIFLLQWIWVVTALCLHGEVSRRSIILILASHLPKECDILLSMVELLNTKCVGSKNRTEGWCREMACQQPHKLFWAKMLGVWNWCSWKRQGQKGILQNCLPIIQILDYCNATITCVHMDFLG